jgi:hypothetical protein
MPGPGPARTSLIAHPGRLGLVTLKVYTGRHGFVRVSGRGCVFRVNLKLVLPPPAGGACHSDPGRDRDRASEPSRPAAHRDGWGARVSLPSRWRLGR